MLAESCHLEMTNDQRLSKHLLGVSKCQEVQACNTEVLISLSFWVGDSLSEIKQTIKTIQPNKQNPQTKQKKHGKHKTSTGERAVIMNIQHCCNADKFCDLLIGSGIGFSTRKLVFSGQRLSSASRVGAQEFLAAQKAQANEYIQVLLDKGACVNKAVRSV